MTIPHDVDPAKYGVRSTSKAHLTVWKKGYFAALQGELPRCPYRDHRGGKFGNIVTGSRGFIHYWLDGYRAGSKDRNEKGPTASQARSRKGPRTSRP